MSGIPTFQDGEIEKRVGARSLRRGWEYFQKGALRQLRRQGKKIQGLCRGTSFEPYRVWVLFNDTGVAEADCSCPIGQGGHCKHVAALLIAWREKPQAFRPLEEIESVLDRCTRRELMEIVKKQLELHPEMEEVISSWAPKVAADRSPPDAAAYRSQVKALLQQAGRSDPPDWERAAERLWAIQEIAEAFSSQRESENASVVYRAILEEMLAYEQADEIFHWPLSRIVDACVEGLEKVLSDRETAPDIRTGVLRTLLALLRRNLELFGSLREDVVELFRRQTTPTEKSLLSQWIDSLAGLADSQATRRLLGGMLLELAGQDLDFEGFARICRSTGRHFDLIRRLVLWGRVGEALQEAQHLAEDELLQLADLLVAAGRSAQAVEMVQKRLADRPQGPLADWLAEHQQTQEHRNQLVNLAEQMFRLQPNFDSFLQLRQAARSVGRWDQLRSQLLVHLEQAGQWGLLSRILLEEKELGRALTLLQTHPPEHLETWETEIAQAAERLYPAEALEIYRRRVDRLVAQHTPHHYAEACRLLRKIRSLMKRSGTGQEWPAYLADFRSRHRGLPALLEELAKAGL